MAGIAYGIGEAAVPLTKQFLSNAYKYVFQKAIAGVTPETQAANAAVQAIGGVPPLKSVLPGAKSLAAKQALTTLLTGDPLIKRNMAATREQIIGILTATKLPREDIENFLDGLVDHATLEGNEAGRKVVNAIKDLHATLTDGQKQELARAESLVRLSETQYQQLAFSDQRTQQDFGRRLSDIIWQAREQHAETYRRLYADWAAKSNYAEIVPMSGVAVVAQEIRENINPLTAPGTLRELSRIRSGTYYDVGRAQAILAELNTIIRGANSLMPKTDIGKIAHVRDALEAAFRSAGDVFQDLQQINNRYAIDSERFNADMVNTLANMKTRNATLDPEGIAKLVYTQNSSQFARLVYSFIEKSHPQMMDELGRIQLRNFLLGAPAKDAAGRAVIDGSSLAQILDTGQGQFWQQMHPELAEGLRPLADKIMALNGKITDFSAIERGDFKSAMEQAVKYQEGLQAFLKNDLFKGLYSKPASDTYRAAIDMAINPKNRGTELLSIYRHLTGRFGGDSQNYIWQDIQRAAVLKIFSQAFRVGQGKETKLSESELTKVFNQYSPEVRSILFPENMDRKLIELSKTFNIMFPEGRNSLNPGVGGSLASAAILLHVSPFIWQHKVAAALGAVAWSYSFSWLSTHPAVVNFLVNEIRRDPTSLGMVGRFMGQIVAEHGNAATHYRDATQLKQKAENATEKGERSP